MIFHWPHLLWLLVPLAILGILDAARRSRDETRQPWPKILRAWAGARAAIVGAQRGAARSRLLLWLGLALGVVALARPQWGRVEEPMFDQSREIVIALDLSRSMLATDVAPSRLERARLLIQGLLDSLRGERVGLVVFAGTAFLQVPLSADYEVLDEFLPALTPAYMPVGGTDYGAMLRAALDAFSAGSSADRYLIVLSDGESLTEDWKDLTDDLRRADIRVIGLGVGTAQGSFIPDGTGGYLKDERGAVVLSKLDSATLQALAGATSGVYTDASSWVDLGALLKQTVATGRRGEFKEQSQARQLERYQWALGPALLCLLLSLWREFPVRPRTRSLPLAGAAGPQGAGARGQPDRPAGAAVAATLLLCACTLLASRLRAAEDTSVYAAPLSNLVARLCMQPELSAGDCRNLAEETVTWGRRLREARQTVPPGPVRDALLGVDAGQRLDAKAADWPELRSQLEDLLKKLEQPPPPPPQPQPQSQQQQQSQSQQQNAPDQPPPQEKEQPPPTERPNTGETQRIGGQPEPTRESKTNPSLAMPIQKLDQLRNQDSPAQLFQMLDSRVQKPPPKKGRDW